MSLTAIEHALMLGRLLPEGPAWPTADQSAGADAFHKLLAAMAIEPARVGASYDLILEELIPDNANTDLAAWERIVGVPIVPLTDAQRLDRIRGILNGRGTPTLEALELFIQRVSGNPDARLFNRVGPRSVTGATFAQCGDRLRAGEWDFTALCELMPNVLGVGPDAFEAWTGFGGPALVLDLITAPALCAVSYWHKLRTAYAGPAVRVRKSSGGEQDIGFVGGVLDTASLLAFTGSDSGFVAALYDQGPTGRHFTQTNPAWQPRIVNAGVLETEGAVPTIYFDGITGLTAPGPGLTGSPNVTVGNAVHCLNSGNAFAWAFGPGANVADSRMTFNRSGTGFSVIYKEHNGSGKAFTPLLDPGTAARYYVMQHAAGGTVNTGTLRQNGVDLSSPSAVGTGVLALQDGVIVLGNLPTGGFGTPCKQNIFAMFNAHLIGAELGALETELGAHV